MDQISYLEKIVEILDQLGQDHISTGIISSLFYSTPSPYQVPFRIMAKSLSLFVSTQLVWKSNVNVTIRMWASDPVKFFLIYELTCFF